MRPRLSARITGLGILGAPLVLEGVLKPADAGRLRVTIGARVRAAGVDAKGAFRVRLPARRAGRVCARLTLSPADGYVPLTRRRCARITTPALRLGAHGAGVRFLQQRLSHRHYALLGADGRFGTDTRDAVYAFQKVEGLARDGVAGPAVWRRLLVARTPAATAPGTHIEVDKRRQVLFEVVGGRVRLVAHVSTGATGNTPVGTWHIYAKIPGTNALGMFDSMYFLRGFAIHGYASVPPWPASHGCVRVPMWLAPRLYARWPVGSPVIVRP
jgi:hypothetical protein